MRFLKFCPGKYLDFEKVYQYFKKNPEIDLLDLL
jgi:hypothetical protein